MGSWCPSKHTGQNLYKNALRSHDLKERFEPRLHIWSLSCLGRGALDRSYDVIYVPYDNPTLIEGLILY